MMEQMTLNELKVGMHVKLRDESVCVVSMADGLILIDVTDGTHEYFHCYNDNMTSKTTPDLDIVEVVDRNGKIIFAEETMTKAEAEIKFGIRIID